MTSNHGKSHVQHTCTLFAYGTVIKMKRLQRTLYSGPACVPYTFSLPARKFLSPPAHAHVLYLPLLSSLFRCHLRQSTASKRRSGAKRESDASPFPIPHTSHLPVFVDNVLPSILIHLGVVDLSTATSASSLALAGLFPARDRRHSSGGGGGAQQRRRRRSRA
jgi:hypothetical protein